MPPQTAILLFCISHSTYTYIFSPPCNKDSLTISSHPRTPLCAFLNLDPLHTYTCHPNLPLPSLCTSPQLPFHTSTKSIPVLSQSTPPHTYSLHFTPTRLTPTCPTTWLPSILQSVSPHTYEPQPNVPLHMLTWHTFTRHVTCLPTSTCPAMQLTNSPQPTHNTPIYLASSQSYKCLLTLFQLILPHTYSLAPLQPFTCLHILHKPDSPQI